jgi:lambda repressor-like predicted transcriptional regulator
VERGIPVKELAEKMGIVPQTLSNKLYRNVFTYQEFVKMADILDCDVRVITRDTGKEFS